MAEAYRRINPDVRYLGIELNPEAAQAARDAGRLDRVIAGDAAAVDPSALGLPDARTRRRLPDLRRRARAHGRPLERPGQAGRLGSRRRAGAGVHPQRPALLGDRQPAPRELELSRRGAARPDASPVLHAGGNSRALHPGGAPGLRRPAADRGATRTPSGSGRSWPRSSGLWGSIRPGSRPRPRPCSTWSGPFAGSRAGPGPRIAPLVAPGLGDRQRGADPGAPPVPGDHAGRARRDRDRAPVRGPGPDLARRGSGLPPAADRDPDRRSPSLAARCSWSTAT